MDGDPPVEIQELLQLQNLGVASNHVTFTRITMTSENHICLKCKQTDENAGKDGEQALILDLEKDGCQSIALPSQCNYCMVSPVHQGSQPMLAIQEGDCLQIVSVANREKLHSCHIAQLHFWTWLNHKTIGIVTATAVMKWTIGKEPQDVFAPCQRLEDAEIVGLKTDAEFKWFALIGLLPQVDAISGLTELYSAEKQLSQCISAHAVSFCQHRFAENQHATTVMCAATRDTDNGAQGKLHIVELGPHVDGNLAPCSLTENLQFLSDQDRCDFPAAVQISSEFGLVYILSKYGHLFVADIETATCLCSTVISEDIVFASTLNTQTQGVLGINTRGQVFNVDVKIQQLLEHCTDTLKKTHVAQRLKKAVALMLAKAS